MNIPMPTEAEKKESISYIKKEGLERKDNLFTAVVRVYREIGMRNIFFGVADCIYIALVIALAAFGFAFSLNSDELRCAVSLVSPLFFIAAQYLTVWKDSMTGTYEVKAACKYKPSHITAFRMLFFSTVSIALDVPASYVAAKLTGNGFLGILLISFFALFVYSLAMVLIMICIKNRAAEYILPGLWVSLHIIPFFKGSEWLATVNVLESGAGVALCVVCALLYVAALDFLVKKGERKYAYR